MRAEYSGSNRVTVEPHAFVPLLTGWRTKFNFGRCRHCFVPESHHPIVDFWVPARPLGNHNFRIKP